MRILMAEITSCLTSTQAHKHILATISATSINISVQAHPA